MTAKEVIASGYDSSQFMILKHLDSWFCNNNKENNKMCIWVSHIYSEDTVGHAEPVTDLAEGNIKEGTQSHLQRLQ